MDIDDGIDTTFIREGVEMDISADGSTPFRCPMWFDDVPDADTGEYFIENELQESLRFWGMT